MPGRMAAIKFSSKCRMRSDGSSQDNTGNASSLFFFKDNFCIADQFPAMKHPLSPLDFPVHKGLVTFRN